VREGDSFPSRITRKEAREILAKDLRSAEASVLRLITAPLNQHQFDALVSFTFNLGGGALQRSTIRVKINRREYEEAASQFMRWVWAGGKKLEGLVRRRKAESEMFLRPVTGRKLSK
jgi:lysozyme